jgi:hypothetical protein
MKNHICVWNWGSIYNNASGPNGEIFIMLLVLRTSIIINTSHSMLEFSPLLHDTDLLFVSGGNPPFL